LISSSSFFLTVKFLSASLSLAITDDSLTLAIVAVVPSFYLASFSALSLATSASFSFAKAASFSFANAASFSLASAASSTYFYQANSAASSSYFFFFAIASFSYFSISYLRTTSSWSAFF